MSGAFCEEVCGVGVRGGWVDGRGGQVVLWCGQCAQVSYKCYNPDDYE